MNEEINTDIEQEVFQYEGTIKHGKEELAGFQYKVPTVEFLQGEIPVEVAKNIQWHLIRKLRTHDFKDAYKRDFDISENDKLKESERDDAADRMNAAYEFDWMKVRKDRKKVDPYMTRASQWWDENREGEPTHEQLVKVAEAIKDNEKKLKIEI